MRMASSAVSATAVPLGRAARRSLPLPASYPFALPRGTRNHGRCAASLALCSTSALLLLHPPRAPALAVSMTMWFVAGQLAARRAGQSARHAQPVVHPPCTALAPSRCTSRVPLPPSRARVGRAATLQPRLAWQHAGFTLQQPLRSLSRAPRAYAAKDKSKESKAKAAAKAVKKGNFKKERKVRKSVIFHRPKTLKRERNPRFPRVRCVSCHIAVDHVSARARSLRHLRCGGPSRAGAGWTIAAVGWQLATKCRQRMRMSARARPAAGEQRAQLCASEGGSTRLATVRPESIVQQRSHRCLWRPGSRGRAQRISASLRRLSRPAESCAACALAARKPRSG